MKKTCQKERRKIVKWSNLCISLPLLDTILISARHFYVPRNLLDSHTLSVEKQKIRSSMKTLHLLYYLFTSYNKNYDVAFFVFRFINCKTKLLLVIIQKQNLQNYSTDNQTSKINMKAHQNRLQEFQLQLKVLAHLSNHTNPSNTEEENISNNHSSITIFT